MNKFLIAALLLGAGYAAGYFATPVKIKERIVTRDVIKIKRDTVTVSVTRPDGTVETTTRETDRSSSERDTIKSKEKLVSARAQWQIAAFAPTTDLFTAPLGNNFVLTAQRRIIGPFFAGAFVSRNLDWGLGVGIEF